MSWDNDEHITEYKNLNEPVIQIRNIEHTGFSFVIGDETVLKLTKDGLLYKGTLIEDAGEIYKLFTEYLKGAHYE